MSIKETNSNPENLKKLGWIGLGIGLVGTGINSIVAPKVQENQMNEKIAEEVAKALNKTE